MTESEFWQLVKADDLLASGEQIGQDLKRKLSLIDDQSLADFDKHFNLRMRQSYTWELWGAAYVMAACNCEDGFAEFRSWLISRGEEIFSITMEHADDLANFDVVAYQQDKAYPFLDDYDLIAGLIYEERSGKELPYVASGQVQPKGKRFKDKAKFLQARYPKLFHKYWPQ